MALLFVPTIRNVLNPSDIFIKCANFNRRPIQNCTSVYTMKLCTVSSDFIIIRRPFALIKVTISSDPIDCLLCNQREVHLSDEDMDKANGPQLIWPDFYWSILRCKNISNHSYSKFIWKIVPLGWREWSFYDIVLQFLAYYKSIFITEPQ